uniref:Uncharacterized protein n=1 Tax=Branchiostoma floridae TaxID=7739 RepID=C3XW05_BRAFL|eukprot:XP_002611781.1 hypothetical protein BRAFLDRAFT_128890 [Branchiostoma floridae]
MVRLGGQCWHNATVYTVRAAPSHVTRQSTDPFCKLVFAKACFPRKSACRPVRPLGEPARTPYADSERFAGDRAAATSRHLHTRNVSRTGAAGQRVGSRAGAWTGQGQSTPPAAGSACSCLRSDSEFVPTTRRLRSAVQRWAGDGEEARPRVVSYNVPKKNWIYYPNINRSYIIDKTYNPRIKTATDYYMPHRDLPREAPHHPLSAPAGKPRVTQATYPAYAANHKYIGQGRLEMDWNTSYTMAFNKPEGKFPVRYTPTAHRDPLPRLGTYPPNPTQAWGQHVRNSKDYYESWPNTPSKAAFVGNTQEQLYQHSDQDFYRPGPLKPGQNDGRVAGKPYESLRGARVVVTGCSSGIGEQMAYHYARLGAKVVAKMKDLGAQEAIYVAGDMGKSEDCERTIQTAKEKFGGLDYLVLNHMGSSYNKGGPFLWDGDMAFLEDFTNINYLSYVRLASLALPMLEQSNGSVVVVSSLLGKIAGTFGSFYSGAKFALDGFFSSLRQELQLKKANVTITLAVLGLIDTELSMNSAKVIGIENLAKITALSAEDAAMAIIRSGAVRQRELYYPWSMVWPLSTLRALFPQLLDWMEMQKFLI